MPRIVTLRSAFAAVLLIALSARTALAVVPAFEPPLPVTPSAMTDQGFDAGAVAATNGSGTWVVAWSSNDRLGGANLGDDDILFARSTDGGLTFSAEAALNTDYETDTQFFYTSIAGKNDDRPALAAHGSRFIAAWHRSTFPVGEFIQLARSDDGGISWTPNSTLFDNSDAPAIATDGAGTWVIVWEHTPTGNFFLPSDLYFTRSTDDGLTWSTPAVLNAGAAGDSLRDIPGRLVYSGGVWVLVSNASSLPTAAQSDVRYWRSVDGGATWSAPAPLDTSGSDAYRSAPAVAGDGTGNWVAVWQSAPSPNGESDIVSARSVDGALTWSAPTVVNTDNASDGQKDTTPDVATGGGIYRVVWTREGTAANPGSNHQDALTASSSDGGLTWSAPTPLNPGVAAAAANGTLEYGARVAFDPGGWYFAYWASNDSTLASGTKGADMDIVMALAGHPCGNGVLDPGEACDDGDRGSLDCCGRACAYDPAGAVCAADADPCTLERCDGAGTCGHVNAPLGTPCAADTDLCTLDRCDGNDLCEHVVEPRTDCLVPLAPKSATLQLRGGADPSAQKLKWIWKHGPATVISQFAIYITGANTALCVYDDSGLVARVDTPVDASCKGGASCWNGLSGTLKYKDPAGTPNGATVAMIKAKAGKTSAKLLGKGGNLELPALPIASLPLRTQLISENGICLESTFSSTGLKTNAAGVFKGKSD